MTLTDPTAGLGYAWGAKLPSADVNTVFNQQPDAVDGAAGGTYNPSADIEIGTNTIKLLTTKQLEYASRTIYKYYPPIYTIATGTWVYVGGCGVRNTATSGADIEVPLCLPNGQVLDSCEVSYIGAGGHPNPIGVTAPYFRLYKVDNVGSSTPITAAISDPETDPVNYEVYHQWSTSGIGETIDNTTYTYVIYLSAESNPGYIANAVYRQIKLGFTVTSQPEV